MWSIARRTYDFTIRWGIETDTDDADGSAVKTSDARPTREAIEAALPGFTGDIMQTPPSYSAIKVDGERAYDLAREGEAVELEPRMVSISSLRSWIGCRPIERGLSAIAARAPMCAPSPAI